MELSNWVEIRKNFQGYIWALEVSLRGLQHVPRANLRYPLAVRSLSFGVSTLVWSSIGLYPKAGFQDQSSLHQHAELMSPQKYSAN